MDTIVTDSYKEYVYQKWLNKDWGLDLHEFPESTIRPNRPRASENSILFLVEYLIGVHMRGKFSERDRKLFISAVKAIESHDGSGGKIKGLYDRGSEESLLSKDKIRTISHDNLTAIASFSFLIGENFHKDIYEHGKRNFWRFDNVYPENPRLSRVLHPRDILFISLVGGGCIARNIARFSLPILCLIQILSCIKTYKIRPKLHERIGNFFRTGKWEEGRRIIHTDGKILTFVRTYSVLMRKNYWFLSWGGYLCHLILKDKFGKNYLHRMFEIYFKDDGHPVRHVFQDTSELLWWESYLDGYKNGFA